jgi:hypothetical protein
MKAKPKSKTERSLMRSAEKALSGENLAEMGPASKPLSLHPLKLETAVSALLKVKPMPKQ